MIVKELLQISGHSCESVGIPAEPEGMSSRHKIPSESARILADFAGILAESEKIPSAENSSPC